MIVEIHNYGILLNQLYPYLLLKKLELTLPRSQIKQFLKYTLIFGIKKVFGQKFYFVNIKIDK